MMPAKALTLAALLALPALAAAQSPEEAAEAALEARHGYMTMLGIELGQLAGMAKGDIAYDAAAASRAAANIVALGQYDATGLFIPGTSADEIEGSEALPAIWERPEDFRDRFAALSEAAEGSPDAVAAGPDSLGPVLQKLGGACNQCHDDFRKKD